MTQEWDRQKAESFVSMADITIPERKLQFAMVADLVHFDAQEEFTFIDIGCGEGLLAKTILDRYPRSVCHASDIADEMIARSQQILASHSQRATISKNNIHEPDYLDRVVPGQVGFITSSLAIHHCSDVEKSVLYQAAFRKLTSPGAMIIADAVKPVSDHGVAINKKYWQEYIRRQSVE